MQGDVSCAALRACTAPKKLYERCVILIWAVSKQRREHHKAWMCALSRDLSSWAVCSSSDRAPGFVRSGEPCLEAKKADHDDGMHPSRAPGVPTTASPGGAPPAWLCASSPDGLVVECGHITRACSSRRWSDSWVRETQRLRAARGRKRLAAVSMTGLWVCVPRFSHAQGPVRSEWEADIMLSQTWRCGRVGAGCIGGGMGKGSTARPVHSGSERAMDTNRRHHAGRGDAAPQRR